MTAPMSKAPSSSHQETPRRLEVAYFDWQSARVQFALGFALILLCLAVVVSELFATRFLPSEYLYFGDLVSGLKLIDGVLSPLSSNPPFLAEVSLFEHHSWLYRLTTFLLQGGTALFVGLIAFDTTMRYGNRAGAAAAIFASLLSLVAVCDNGLCLPSLMHPAMASNLLGLIAVYSDSRGRILKDAHQYRSALVVLALAGIFDVRGTISGFIAIVLSRLFILDERLEETSLQRVLKILPFALVAALFLIPHLVKNPIHFGTAGGIISLFGNLLLPQAEPASLLALIGLATCLVLAIVRLLLGSLWLRPLFFSLAALLLCLIIVPSLSPSDTAPGLFLAPWLSIAISFFALPDMDVISKKLRVTLTIFGAISLSLVVIAWGLAVSNSVRATASQSKALGLFKMDLVKRLQTSNTEVVVVNPPFCLNENEKRQDETTWQQDKGMSGSNAHSRALLRIRQKEFTSYQAMLDSPLSQDRLDISVIRRRPTAFVRLARKDASSSGSDHPVTDYYVWDEKLRQIMPLYYSGNASFSLEIDEDTVRRLKTEPVGLPRLTAQSWSQLENGSGYIEKEGAGLRVVPPKKQDLTIWFPIESLDPTRIKKLEITMADAIQEGGQLLSLVFRGTESDEIDAIEFFPDPTNEHTMTARTQGESGWLKHKAIGAVGIKLLGGGCGIVLKSMKTSSDVK